MLQFSGARVHDIKDVAAILDAFQAHGHNEVLLPVPRRRFAPLMLNTAGGHLARLLHGYQRGVPEQGRLEGARLAD